VTLEQMIRALVAAVESPPTAGTQRIVEVPEIRAAIVGRDRVAAPPRTA
jgi:hypothetical protein